MRVAELARSVMSLSRCGIRIALRRNAFAKRACGNAHFSRHQRLRDAGGNAIAEPGILVPVACCAISAARFANFAIACKRARIGNDATVRPPAQSSARRIGERFASFTRHRIDRLGLRDGNGRDGSRRQNAAATSSFAHGDSPLLVPQRSGCEQSCAEAFTFDDAQTASMSPPRLRMQSAKPGNDVAIISASSTITGSFDAMPSTRNDIATR